MLDIESYIKSLPPKNHPSFAPPCCPRLESMYNNLFSNTEIIFENKTGIFRFQSKKAAQFSRLNIEGGQDWVPSLEVSGSQLVLIKNPNSDENLLKNFGARNGLTIINNQLIALGPRVPVMLEVRRPVRQTHLPKDSRKLITQFQEFAAKLEQ